MSKTNHERRRTSERNSSSDDGKPVEEGCLGSEGIDGLSVGCPENNSLGDLSLFSTSSTYLSCICMPARVLPYPPRTSPPKAVGRERGGTNMEAIAKPEHI